MKANASKGGKAASADKRAKLTQVVLDDMARWVSEMRKSGVSAITGVEVPDDWLAALLIEHARMTKALEAADALASGANIPGTTSAMLVPQLVAYFRARRSRAVPKGLR